MQQCSEINSVSVVAALAEAAAADAAIYLVKSEWLFSCLARPLLYAGTADYMCSASVFLFNHLIIYFNDSFETNYLKIFYVSRKSI